MRKIKITVTILACLLVGGLVCLWNQPHSSSAIGIQFIGLTNNSSGLLGTSEKLLAVFSVTNDATVPVRALGFYYIETGTASVKELTTYSPLGSPGTIIPHGRGTILTRIPTNAGSWRVVVPYSEDTPMSIALDGVRDAFDRKLGRPRFGFERFAKGAPTSDWVKE